MFISTVCNATQRWKTCIYTAIS